MGRHTPATLRTLCGSEHTISLTPSGLDLRMAQRFSSDPGTFCLLLFSVISSNCS
jgi:hypothetical protein